MADFTAEEDFSRKKEKNPLKMDSVLVVSKVQVVPVFCGFCDFLRLDEFGLETIQGCFRVQACDFWIAI